MFIKCLLWHRWPCRVLCFHLFRAAPRQPRIGYHATRHTTPSGRHATGSSASVLHLFCLQFYPVVIFNLSADKPSNQRKCVLNEFAALVFCCFVRFLGYLAYETSWAEILPVASHLAQCRGAEQAVITQRKTIYERQQQM